jgi:hypothetical protein
MSSNTILSWILLGIALAACAGFFVANIALNNLAETRKTYALVEARARDNAARSEHVKELVNSTALARAELENSIGADIVSVVDTIEGAGRSVGVLLKVASAQPESSNAADVIKPIAFNVEGEGSFADLTDAVHLLERLPYAADIREVLLEKAGEGENAWKLRMRIRLLSSATLSL